MQVGDSPMHPAAVPSAAPLASSLAVAAETPTAVVDIEIVMHARCIPRPAPVAATRPRYLSSHAMTGLSIAAIASNRNAQAAPTTDGPAGNLHDRDFSKTGRFV
jgi:hypothetical protein